MTRRMYRAYMEVKRESRKPHRTRSDFKDRRKFWKTMRNSSKTIIPVPEVIIEFVKIDNTIYGGRLT